MSVVQELVWTTMRGANPNRHFINRPFVLKARGHSPACEGGGSPSCSALYGGGGGSGGSAQKGYLFSG